jgi:putative FmdB family regulatory protein
MPHYDYFCHACKKIFPKILTLAEYEKGSVACPHCGSKKVEQKVAPFYVVTSRKSAWGIGPPGSERLLSRAPALSHLKSSMMQSQKRNYIIRVLAILAIVAAAVHYLGVLSKKGQLPASWPVVQAEVVATKMGIESVYESRRGSKVSYGGDYRLKYVVHDHEYFLGIDSHVSSRDPDSAKRLVELGANQNYKLKYNPENPNEAYVVSIEWVAHEMEVAQCCSGMFRKPTTVSAFSFRSIKVHPAERICGTADKSGRKDWPFTERTDKS